MIAFILNDKEINTALPPGMLLLDFIRYNQHLTGTKIGCREGDCGACTVLTGTLQNGHLQYQSATSCLMALGNAQGKHIVTIEGLNMDKLNPVQQAMSDEGATQCGFCTPGFVVSFAGFCLNEKKPDYPGAIAAVNGNICRCTGYKSIERAAATITALMDDRKSGDAILYATVQHIVPAYFNTIKERLLLLQKGLNTKPTPLNGILKMLGGGTDLYVQQPEAMIESDINFLFDQSGLKRISEEGNKCIIGGGSTVTDMLESSIIQHYFPQINRFIKLISSTPIRNMATIAGNFVNASPIGDLSIFFLALDAQLVLNDGNHQRELPLRDLYKGYKTLAKSTAEKIEKIWFILPGKHSYFNFEKVSKRTHLDIASVNTAMTCIIENDIVATAGISAGGVGPVPLFLKKASAFLQGKSIADVDMDELLEIVQSEISPISDARGAANYKRLLLSQLIRAHFITLFPNSMNRTFHRVHVKQ